MEDIVSWATHLFVYVLLVVPFAFLLASLLARRQKITWIELIPGPKAWPIIGNTPDFIVDPREFFQRCMGYIYIWNFHAPIARFWGGGMAVVDLYRPETVEAVLCSSKHITKSSDYDYLHPWLGTGLLTSTGKKWFSRRKMLTPAFHFTILEDFVGVFNKQSNKFVSRLQEKADGKPFDIFPYVTLCTLDIIFETALGSSINAQDDTESEYVKAVHRISSLIQLRQVRPWLQPDFLFRLSGMAKEHDDCIRILHGTAYQAIRSRRNQSHEMRKGLATEQRMSDGNAGKKRLAFLDLLLDCTEDDHPLTDESIREEVDTFMFEGHDTTSAAINWSLYLLGCYPEIQERVYEELTQVFGTSNRPVTIADLRQLKYTENCIKEALRLYPSVPMMARELREDVVISNYRIPAGTTLAILPYRLHRDPAHFTKPEVYDPDRFLPENSQGRHPYAYIPFSAGPRNCIGQKFALMEEKVVLCNILRRYRVESTIRREDIRVLAELILKPENGNILKLFPRE
ncbi:cytochrome P450 4c3-like isoform X1 [Macrobrachium nipponense]|uniref:cytochrome P450 4c3-like isoform X1 n=1 Tax=Macrobrachium nipponense TaxID=159736 RepID=UPI0030C8112A